MHSQTYNMPFKKHTEIIILLFYLIYLGDLSISVHRDQLCSEIVYCFISRKYHNVFKLWVNIKVVERFPFFSFLQLTL